MHLKGTGGLKRRYNPNYNAIFSPMAFEMAFDRLTDQP